METPHVDACNASISICDFPCPPRTSLVAIRMCTALYFSLGIGLSASPWKLELARALSCVLEY